MDESATDLMNLQKLIDKSIANAGGFLKSSFEMPTHSLNAEQLVKFIGKIKTIAFGSVTRDGEPRVAPVGGIFYRAHFYLPTVASSLRARHVKRQPAVSLTYYSGEDIAVIIHGYAEIIAEGHKKFQTLLDFSGINLQSWGKGKEGVFIKVNPEKLFTYVRYPNQF